MLDDDLERAIEIGESQSWFNCDFLYSLRDNLVKYNNLTPRQEAALQNIMAEFDRRGLWFTNFE